MSEKCECVNVRKVVIVGCGFVGSASAFALMQSGLFSEMVLIDVDKDRAEGEAMDISHGASFAGPMKIYAGGYEDVGDAAIIVITAGANQKPNETRLAAFFCIYYDVGIENPDLFLPYISAKGDRYGLDHPVFSAGRPAA